MRILIALILVQMVSPAWGAEVGQIDCAEVKPIEREIPRKIGLWYISQGAASVQMDLVNSCRILTEPSVSVKCRVSKGIVQVCTKLILYY